MIRRASFEDADTINEYFWRDFGRRNGAIGEYLADRMNVCLLSGEGGALFVWRGPGIFEVHVFFEQRRWEAVKISREMLKWMREQQGARLFWAAVPIESRHVATLAKRMGWKSQGVAELAHGWCEMFVGE